MATTLPNSFNTDEDCKLQDSAKLRFGSGTQAGGTDNGDISFAWDGTDFDILQGTANSSFKWGIDGAGIDQVWYGDTASTNMTWDQSADSLIFSDNAKAVFGDGSDVTIRWDATDLDILVAANNTVIKIGNGTASADLWVYGSVAGNYILWDASANSLTAVGAATIRPLTAIADPGNAGAIPVTVSGYVPIVTAGAETRTLAAPSFIGQELLIYAKTAVGNGVVTCATTVNETGNNTITFANAGEAVRLIAVEDGANLRWRCATADGAALTTV